MDSFCLQHLQPVEDEWDHLCALVDFALAMKTRLEDVNKHSFNHFQLRVGEHEPQNEMARWV